MGIHVARTSRGTATVRFNTRPGADVRPAPNRPKAGSGASAGGRGPIKTGGSAGTRGDFGADVE